MINKNKKYTYEELDELFLEVESKTLEKLNNMIENAQKESNKDSAIQSMLMNLQNAMCLAELHTTLFKGEDNE